MTNIISVNQAEAALTQGAVGVLPTDTVYGLVCQAHNRSAVERLYALKKREQKPGTVVASSIEKLVTLGIPRRYLKAVEQFWPNPISIVLPTTEQLSYLHLGKYSLACRIPDNSIFRKFIEKTGPLLTSSANLPGMPPAETMTEAVKYFGNNVDFYVDGGKLSNTHASTIIRMIDDAVEVLREGVVKVTERGEVTK